MTQEQLSYLNACIIAAKVNSGSLRQLAKRFNYDWQSAWQAIKTPDIDPAREWEKVERADLQLIPNNDPRYSKLLGHIKGAPIALYLRGETKLLNHRCIAVVGSRKMTEYGQRAAYQIASELASAGLTITSGLAMGIDGVAHQAAVDRSAPTIAVLGGEVSQSSIRLANRRLADLMLKQGSTIISECPLGTPIYEATFAERNRIVSGLSLGVVVVEAAEDSGALITASSAADQGRDVFVVPGSIFSPVSRGTHALIKKGARLITSAEDVLAEYPELTSRQPKLALTSSNPTEAKILKFLSETPRSLNELVRLSNLTAPLITASLMNLELNDKVINLGGNRYTVK